jgi:hypothetical protein
LRADGGFAQGRRAQDWADSLEDREYPGLRSSFRRSAACMTQYYQHGFSTRFPRVATVFGRRADDFELDGQKPSKVRVRPSDDPGFHPLTA